MITGCRGSTNAITSKVNIPERAGVYIIWEEGEVIYIGQTNNFNKRLAAHPFLNNDETYAEIELMMGKKQRINREQELLERFDPKYNNEKTYCNRDKEEQ